MVHFEVIGAAGPNMPHGSRNPDCHEKMISRKSGLGEDLLGCVPMPQEPHKHHHKQIHETVWARPRAIRTAFGLTATQLARYATDGLIRTAHVIRPGQTRGVRLYHLADIQKLITSNIVRK